MSDRRKQYISYGNTLVQRFKHCNTISVIEYLSPTMVMCHCPHIRDKDEIKLAELSFQNSSHNLWPGVTPSWGHGTYYGVIPFFFLGF